VSRRRRTAVALFWIAALAAALMGAWIFHRPAESPRMMRVGGVENPCTCTQRIEP